MGASELPVPRMEPRAGWAQTAPREAASEGSSASSQGSWLLLGPRDSGTREMVSLARHVTGHR